MTLIRSLPLLLLALLAACGPADRIPVVSAPPPPARIEDGLDRVNGQDVRALVRMVDRKADELTATLGDMTEARTLLLSALLIADELNDLRGAAAVARNESPAESAPDPAYAVAIERIAERVERLASQLQLGGE